MSFQTTDEKNNANDKVTTARKPASDQDFTSRDTSRSGQPCLPVVSIIAILLCDEAATSQILLYRSSEEYEFRYLEIRSSVFGSLLSGPSSTAMVVCKPLPSLLDLSLLQEITTNWAFNLQRRVCQTPVGTLTSELSRLLEIPKLREMTSGGATFHPAAGWISFG